MLLGLTCLLARMEDRDVWHLHPVTSGSLAGAVVLLWPLVVILGAATSSAGAVLDERSRDTALQIVLTPVSARAIAAAKVLPYLPAWLVGLAAALPLYLWAGDYMILHGTGGLPLTPWPLRLSSAPDVPHWQLRLTGPGAGVGLTMWLTDAALVWAAANWGATCAVQAGRWSNTLVRLAGQAALATVFLSLFVVASTIIGFVAAAVAALGLAVLPRSVDDDPLITLCAGIGLGTGYLVFFVLLRLRFLVEPSEKAVRAFSWFDRLAMDEELPDLWNRAGAGGSAEDPPARL